MLKILNIIKELNHGGSCRSVLSIAKVLFETGDCEITIATLIPNKNKEIGLEAFGIKILSQPSRNTLFRAMEAADIVQVNWWNDPVIYDFLRIKGLPPCRMCAFVHVAGDNWPNLLISELVDFVDFVVAGCKYGSMIPLLRNLPVETYQEKVGWVFAATDFNRLEGLQPKRHDTFNVGYVGAVEFKKMHPGFIRMSAAAKIPNARFIVLGKGHIEVLQEQAARLGVSSRFEMTGFVQDIKPYYEKMDVFGYPLCDAPGAELVIQDALYAGIPAVVFGLGGLQDAIHDNFNGIVVNNEKEYAQALEYLYHHPEERKIMGENAKRFAKRVYGANNSARRLMAIYKRLMKRPKISRKWANPKIQPKKLELTTGSVHFLESLGHQATPFFNTLYPSKIGFEKGIERIFKMTPKEKTAILRYNEYYPNDPYLKFWTGLLNESEENHIKSNLCFDKALDLGLPAEILKTTRELLINA